MNNVIKNVKRNVFYGFLNKFILLLFGFVERTLVIHILGVQFLGITGLYKSILDVLSLTEFGFGMAMVYSMYKPIVDGDTHKICALLSYYRKCYRIIGSLILILGILIIPFLRYFIAGDIPKEINIYVAYFISLVNTTISYYLWAYKSAIFTANQRNDILSKCSTCSSVVGYIIKIVFLLCTKNYYIFATAALSINILNNILIYILSVKIFPNYIAQGTLSNEDRKILNEKLKGLFVYKVGGVICNSVDNIIISAFLGLVVLAKYNNYYYVISSFFGILSIYYNSMTASLGNNLITSDVETNYNNFRNLLLLQNWIIGFCATGFLCLFQSFMYIWVGTDLMLPFSIVVTMAIYFYMWKIQDIVTIYKEAAGMWDKDKIRPLVSSLCNLFLSILLAKFIGLLGIIVATTLTQLLIDLPWASHVLYKDYFQKKVYEYYLVLCKGTFLTLVISAVVYGVVNLVHFDGIIGLIIKVMIFCLFTNILYSIVYLQKSEFRHFIKKILKGR